MCACVYLIVCSVGLPVETDSSVRSDYAASYFLSVYDDNQASINSAKFLSPNTNESDEYENRTDLKSSQQLLPYHMCRRFALLCGCHLPLLHALPLYLLVSI